MLTTLIATVALNVIPPAFIAQNEFTNPDGYTYTICTTEQYRVAEAYRNACVGNRDNGIDDTYCAVIAASRYCTPTNRALASKFGEKAPSFQAGKKNRVYQKTFMFKQPTKSEELLEVSSLMCTSEQKQQLLEQYRSCTHTPDVCAKDVANVKELLCEPRYEAPGRSQQVVTEVTSTTIEER